MGLKEIVQGIFGFTEAAHGHTPTKRVGTLNGQPFTVGQVGNEVAWYTPDGSPLVPPPGSSSTGEGVFHLPLKNGKSATIVTTPKRRIFFRGK